MSVALQISPNSDTPTVTVIDGAVHLDGFVEADPEVVRTIDGHQEPERAVHSCLQIGARALHATQATLDTGIVDQAFAGLLAGFDQAGAAHIQTLLEGTEALVGAEDGTVPAVFKAILAETADKMTGLFDPESRTSALALLEQVFTKAADEHLAATRKSLDPGNADSPLGRWKAEFLESVQQQLGLVLTQMTELAAGLAARDARTDLYSLSTLKGFDLEERLHLALSQLASRYGDLAEHVGTAAGATGAKTGDETVRVNPDDTGGRPAVIVFEAKARRMSLSRTIDELDRAMANREAQVAVAVFDDQAKAPTAVPFTHFENKAFVVLDDGADERLLELAYLWARAQARAASAGGDQTLDPARVGEAIADIQRALTKASAIRRGLSGAGNGIRLAGEQLDAMDLDITDALRRLRDLLEE